MFQCKHLFVVASLLAALSASSALGASVKHKKNKKNKHKNIAIQVTQELTEPFSIQDLINGTEDDGDPDGALIVGNLKFDQFSYNVTGEDPEFDETPDVRGIQDDNGFYGIRLGGDFNALMEGDAQFTYRVMTLSGPAIVDIAIDSNAEVLTGDASTGGTVELDNGVNLTFQSTSLEGVEINNPDVTADFDPETTLGVEIDLFAEIGEEGASALSIVDMTFSRATANVIPAPAALPAGLIFLALAAARRTRRIG